MDGNSKVDFQMILYRSRVDRSIVLQLFGIQNQKFAICVPSLIVYGVCG